MIIFCYYFLIFFSIIIIIIVIIIYQLETTRRKGGRIFSKIFQSESGEATFQRQERCHGTSTVKCRRSEVILLLLLFIYLAVD